MTTLPSISVKLVAMYHQIVTFITEIEYASKQLPSNWMPPCMLNYMRITDAIKARITSDLITISLKIQRMGYVWRDFVVLILFHVYNLQTWVAKTHRNGFSIASCCRIHSFTAKRKERARWLIWSECYISCICAVCVPFKVCLHQFFIYLLAHITTGSKRAQFIFLFIGACYTRLRAWLAWMQAVYAFISPLIILLQQLLFVQHNHALHVLWVIQFLVYIVFPHK